VSRFAPGSLYAPVEILSRAEAEEIARRAIKNSPAAETRVSINSNARADTALRAQPGDDERREPRHVDHHHRHRRRPLGERVDQPARRGVARRAAKQATEIAKLVPPNPERMPELGAQQYPPAKERVITLPSPTERAVAARTVTEQARAAGLVATGFIECRAGASALANSKGLFAYDSSAVVTMTATCARRTAPAAAGRAATATASPTSTRSAWAPPPSTRPPGRAIRWPWSRAAT
jgi:hypothetical protein